MVPGSFSIADRWGGMGIGHRLKTSLALSGEKGEKGEKRLIVWPETVLLNGIVWLGSGVATLYLYARRAGPPDVNSA